MPVTKRAAKGAILTTAEMDANWDAVRDRAEHTGSQAASTISDFASAAQSAAAAPIAAAVNAAKVEAAPQFEVAAGQTLALTRALHQGAEITLSGAGATISFSATAQGNGFVFTLRNRRGGAWTVPAFAGATREYSKGAAHTLVESGGNAGFSVYTRNGAMFVEILGDTA